ncbi:class I SAM-dependent methyltransferase [Nonomuraea sp. NPDC049725]|uniref:class I SAM-dependent methyltransferase n=1 Tax=Nonomuraea sp. NPDC049725 TaxID=3154508 RepID=UPI003424AE6F
MIVRGNYGFDAAWALAGLVAGGALLAALAALAYANDVPEAGVAFVFGACYTLASAGSYFYTARRGRFAVWERELARLKGDEELLDLGTGRGAVLMTAARLLEGGRATGVVWHARGEAAVRANAEAEGVADRVEVVTGDPGELPCPDESYDVVVSSRPTRELTIQEAYRVLRPGGLLLVADVKHTQAYEATLRELGVTDVRRRDLGARFWYGGPWAATWLLEARKP